MLYITTLNGAITYPAPATLERATGTDGGLFCPMNLPRYDPAGLMALVQLPAADCVASVLNQFFPVSLRGEDLVSEGKLLPEPVFIRHKIAVAELWDRKTGGYAGMQADLCARLGSRLRARGNWPFVAVNIALLFGIYGDLCRSGWLQIGDTVHLAVAAGEFTMPMAAWYARKMGLPLGEIICVCNDNGAAWELLHRGETRLDGSVVKTGLPMLDIGLPCNLERLVFHVLGSHVAADYAAARARRGVFALNPEQQANLREGLSVSVVGAARANGLIPRIFGTSDYLLSPYTALVYSGLMDFRALGGEGTPALLLAEESPLRWGEAVLHALHLPVENLVSQIGRLQSQAATRRRGD